MTQQNYKIIVNYSGDNPLAIWNHDGQAPTPLKIKCGDTVEFEFAALDGPAGSLTAAVLIASPVDQKMAQPSPFIEGNYIEISAPRTLTAGSTKGVWGFAIAFVIRMDDNNNAYYFLPDPELDVGSILD